MIADSELARTFEIKNHIKTKTAHRRVRDNGCIWEGISLTYDCWVSQCSIKFLMQSNDGVLKENV